MKREERVRWRRNVNCRKSEESVGATEGEGRSSNDGVGVNLISIRRGWRWMERTPLRLVYTRGS